MKLEDLNLALEKPRYLSPVSAWVEHIPFAFAAIELLQPATLVELGTHLGDSYFAFCQAIDQLQLNTRAAAVDTWIGDDQAGQYDPKVVEALHQYHDPLYGRFSRLLQCTFDEAADVFPAESIDLLHIDGLHTYEAVRHDFETWIPKLSQKAVVLFHDTQVRTADFGVHQFWAEISPKYLSFEFTHGYGLGILITGEKLRGKFPAFISWARRSPDLVRSLFSSLGRRIQLARGFHLLTPVLERTRHRHNLHPTSLPPGQMDALSAQNDLKAWIDQCYRNLNASIPAANGSASGDSAAEKGPPDNSIENFAI